MKSESNAKNDEDAADEEFDEEDDENFDQLMDQNDNFTFDDPSTSSKRIKTS